MFYMHGRGTGENVRLFRISLAPECASPHLVTDRWVSVSITESLSSFWLLCVLQKPRHTEANFESYRPHISFMRQMKVLSISNQYPNDVLPNLSVIILDS
jgi:hypothetical protein